MSNIFHLRNFWPQVILVGEYGQFNIRRGGIFTVIYTSKPVNVYYDDNLYVHCKYVTFKP